MNDAVEGHISLDDLENVVSWNYFRLDHLGNNVAVWNALTDSTTQRMFYFPSGLPIGISTGQGTQPYKYNGKEYDEMHGYDVYDYGFRGYYATIARFTSPDPLSEQTPWQSPYSYASNNFTGEIDWMGLFGSSGFASGGAGAPQCIILDNEGYIKALIDDDDLRIYVDEEGDWTPDKGKEKLKAVGWMLAPFDVYYQNFLQAKKEGRRIKAFGFYYGQLNFSVSLSIGVQLEKKISIPPILQKFVKIKKLPAGVNLVSFELLDLSWNYDDGVEADYLGEDNQTKVAQNLSLLFLSLDHEFLIESLSAEYISGTEHSSVSFIAPIYDSEKGDNAPWSFSISGAFGIGYSVSINYSWYYEP